MMETVITVLSWFCLVTGSGFAIIGGIGLLRLPDFYARMHGGGMSVRVARFILTWVGARRVFFSVTRSGCGVAVVLSF